MPFPMLTSLSPLLCITRVGTWMEGRMFLMSMYVFIFARATAAAGLTLSLPYAVNHFLNAPSLAREGARLSSSTSPPHPRSREAIQSSLDFRVGAQGYSSAQILRAKAPNSMRCEAFSGYVAANSALIDPPSLTP